MIELKERRRRTKRKFSDPLNEIDNPHHEFAATTTTTAVKPKETILDMSVSKLAKTRVNLEPSLRKTVMIVNTIRKLERQLDNKDVTTFAEPKQTCDEHFVSNATRTSSKYTNNGNNCNCSISKSEEDNVNRTGTKFNELTLCSGKANKQSLGCENNNTPQLQDNNYRYRSTSFGSEDMSLAKRTPAVNVRGHTGINSRLKNSATSLGYRAVEVPQLVDEEINFAEIDISLYDYDQNLEATAESDINFDDNDNNIYYKTNTGLSALIRRCSDDLKLAKSTETSLTDDLDQIMQVLVEI